LSQALSRRDEDKMDRENAHAQVVCAPAREPHSGDRAKPSARTGSVKDLDLKAFGLGKYKLWPAPLKFALRAAAATRRPTFVFWGEQSLFFGNDEACELLDEPATSPMGHPASRVWPGVWRKMESSVTRVRTGRGIQRQAGLRIRAPGEPRVETSWDCSHTPIFDPRARDGIGGVLTVFAHANAEAAMAENEARLRLATEHAEIGFWDVDPVNDILVWPARVKTMFGISAEQPVSLREDFYLRLHPEDSDRVGEAYAAACDPERRALYDVEYRTIGKEDGLVRWVAAKGRGVFDGQGRCVRVIGTAIDVTPRKLAEERAREASERIELAFDAGAIIGVWDWDLRAGRVTGDERFAFAFGLDPERCRAGVDVEEGAANIHPEDKPSLMAAIEAAIRRGGPFARQYRVRRGDGVYHWVEANGRVYLAPDGTPLRFPGVLLNIGARRKLEAERDQAKAQLAAEQALAKAQAELFEAQKLETIGQLTGGVAHDFNNLLAAILSNLDLARKQIADPRIAKLIDGAVKGAERGASLSRRLLAFARRQELKVATVHVPSLFEGIIDLLNHSLGPGVRIQSTFPDVLPSVRVDSNQLELALLNLAVNARDAMPDGGELNVSAHPERIGVKSGDLAAGDYVRIRIVDTGVGMDKATLKKAVEPFFTTKGVGKGTGLGLSMVQGLALQSGGTLRLQSEFGCGTTADLWLPQARPDEEEQATSVAPAVGGAASGLAPATILVVDDDALVAMGTVAMLEDLGHTVLEANSGRAALEIVSGHPELDLVITDHAMPNMTGCELAAHLRDRRPDLPIILATGFAESPSDRNPRLPRLCKPFRQDEIAAAIDSVRRTQEVSAQ
jgi:PAS domain S-box-containing protein